MAADLVFMSVGLGLVRNDSGVCTETSACHLSIPLDFRHMRYFTGWGPGSFILGLGCYGGGWGEIDDIVVHTVIVLHLRLHLFKSEGCAVLT